MYSDLPRNQEQPGAAYGSLALKGRDRQPVAIPVKSISPSKLASYWAYCLNRSTSHAQLVRKHGDRLVILTFFYHCLRTAIDFVHPGLLSSCPSSVDTSIMLVNCYCRAGFDSY